MTNVWLLFTATAPIPGFMATLNYLSNRTTTHVVQIVDETNILVRNVYYDQRARTTRLRLTSDRRHTRDLRAESYTAQSDV
jgi:hypothetical protein